MVQQSLTSQKLAVRTIRLCLAVLLSVVAALGHASGWVHLMGCTWCVGAVQNQQSCGDCCDSFGFVEVRAEGNDAGSKQDPNGPQTPTDSNSCTVCNSLATLVGAASETSIVSLLETSEFSAVQTSSQVTALWMPLPHPRGPPALA